MNNTGLIHWNGILLRPRRTVNWIIEKNPSQLVILTCVFFIGVFKEVGKVSPKDYSDTSELIDFLLTIFLQGGLMQLLTYTLFIWGVNFCSTSFGGRGKFKETQIAFTWTLLLLFSSGFLLTIFSYSFSDGELFFTTIPNINHRDFLLTYNWVNMTLYILLNAWYIALIIIAISEVHKLSIWKSIGSLFCGLAIIIVPLVVITFVANPSLWYGLL